MIKAILFDFEKHVHALVIADAVINNPASIKILTKLGFTQISIEKRDLKIMVWN